MGIIWCFGEYILLTIVMFPLEGFIGISEVFINYLLYKYIQESSISYSGTSQHFIIASHHKPICVFNEWMNELLINLSPLIHVCPV